MKLSKKQELYEQEVVTRFELYNSLFLTLPFYKVKHTGILLPFFATHCEQGVADKLDPETIIESFFGQYEQYVQKSDRTDLLFRIIQYIERQVVLFDAIEDSVFKKTGRSDDSGMLDSILKQAESDQEMRQKLLDKLQNFALRIVLTAHPTQFYPGSVLGIINDLNIELKKNDIQEVNKLLQQLGKTPFLNKHKPTPVDEAVSLGWFLENVFYQVASFLQYRIDDAFSLNSNQNKSFIEMGFWPGGDRDGNPNVTVESTQKVATLLRTILFRCYYRDFRVLKRRITFRGVENAMDRLQELFYENSFNPLPHPQNVQNEIIQNLQEIAQVLLDHHGGLFIEMVDDLLRKVRIFGCYFASLDIRQDSRILRAAHAALRAQHPEQTAYPMDYDELDEETKRSSIQLKSLNLELSEDSDPMVQDTAGVIRLLKDIQHSGGERAVHRFIISNCQEATDILQLMELFLWNGWELEELTMDFVPLFETVDDLQRAASVMQALYTHPVYATHVKRRGGKQTIMLGFSDSTKDGGYLMANWSIYKAKLTLTDMARQYGIDLAFFDGRGGPPSRGGGKTQRFYASMGQHIANDQIQLTVQGQSISSQYGSWDTALYNMEQLLLAGLSSAVKQQDGDTLSTQSLDLLDDMAQISHGKFLDLRHDPLFLKYLETFSPLKYLSQINISSRPVKRNSDKELRLEDLRAISFVTAWSQLKQNITGFYGVGSALKAIEAKGQWADVQQLYRTSGMFKTIIDNCMMSMSKSNFDLTSYIKRDPVFGPFWTKMRDEYELTKKYVLRLTNTSSLMEAYPVDQRSVALREKIVLPLLLIQHYAIHQLRDLRPGTEKHELYSKLLTRTIYGVVNAGRNLA
jgi:phosphoenolpyruvate carboxylase